MFAFCEASRTVGWYVNSSGGRRTANGEVIAALPHTPYLGIVLSK